MIRIEQPGPTGAEGWLASLLARKSQLAPASVHALRVDTQHIVACVERHLATETSRVISGLVIGAVQSGKTASMLAVAAAAVDAKFDLIVLLSGTRTSLWKQTALRAAHELDGWAPAVDFERGLARFWRPLARVIGGDALNPRDLYEIGAPEGKRHLRDGKPAFFVVMKHGDHLSAASRAIRKITESMDRPLQMLVLDDEADDGSILNDTTSDSADLKAMPRQIVGLWENPGGASMPFHPKLRVAYIAYTATPQANLLQSDHNPLSPRHFVTAIRTPGSKGDPDQRLLPTYAASGSLADWHTGGQEFYPSPRNSFQPCRIVTDPVATDGPAWNRFVADTTTDAIRAFIVASACRLCESKLSFMQARTALYPTRDAAKRATPPICSMLLNPASDIGSHFECAAIVRGWVHGVTASSSQDREQGLPSGKLDWHRLELDLEQFESEWENWLEDYRVATAALRARPEAIALKPPPTWAIVRQTIVEEVLPAIRLKIVNSDEAAEDAPNFDPTLGEDGAWRVTPDLCTLFIAGNVMSRGLTLEGLSTTVFLRNPKLANADTQSQMQRWFGYRGLHLQYCRVFMLHGQHERFKRYKFDDDALRQEIFNRLRSDPDAGVQPQVLQGYTYDATAKVQNIRALPLCPGAHPFVSLISSEPGRDPNVETAIQFANQISWDKVAARGRPRGVVSQIPMDLCQVADFLDSLTYPNHDPSPDAEEHLRWAKLQTAITPPNSNNRLFRPDSVLQSGATSLLPQQCPFTLAAYFRLWSQCAKLSGPGLLANDHVDLPWPHLSVAERLRRIPKIWVGIRFGSLDAPPCDPLNSIAAPLGAEYRPKLMYRKIDNVTSKLISTWGSRNPSDEADAYRGDQFFDYHRPGETRQTPAILIHDTWWRSPGEFGLMLLHFVVPSGDQPAPVHSNHIRLAVGFSLPAGGPDQICALRIAPPGAAQ
jgi:hypothetical protein